MEIKLINNFQDFLSLEDEWNIVLNQSNSDQVFSSFEWIKSWWLAFGKNYTLNILLVTENDAIIGIAPLMLRKIKFLWLKLNKLSFIYNDNAAHADFLIISGKENAALNLILGYLKAGKISFSIIELPNVMLESPNYEIILKNLSKHKFFFALKDGLHSPFIPIKTDWKTFVASKSKKFRKTIHYNRNKLDKVGQFQAEQFQNPEEKIMDCVVEISAKSWKTKCGGDISCSEENKKFFKFLSSSANIKGWVNIWILKFNGQAIAYEYCLKYKGRLYALRSDYNMDYKFTSPGSILSTKVIQNCFEDNLKEIDLCGNKEEYKKKWTSFLRQHHRIVIYNGQLAKIIYLLDYVIYYNLKAFFKRFKFMVNLKQNLYH